MFLLIAKVFHFIFVTRLAILKKGIGVVPGLLSGVSSDDLLQLHLLINVTGLVEPTEPGSVLEKF